MQTLFNQSRKPTTPESPDGDDAVGFRTPRFQRLGIPSLRIAVRITFAAMLFLAALFGSLAGLLLVFSTDLPQIEDLEHYHPSTTTELYDVHGRIFGSFALQRRVVIGYNDFPPVLRQAVISIEDKSFESNWGVNLVRVIGAAYRDLTSGERAQGASTLTMQLTRNLFLSSEKSFGRKVQEVFLSIQIERRFTKKQIFTLYGNQIYLGHGAYGFEAGSQYYFSKHAKDLTLSEAALLAALPKGPEYYSPVHYPDRAFKRRNLVLNSMLEDGAITAGQARAAKESPLGLRIESPPNSVAPWFVEEVRRQLEKRYGVEQVHEAGLKVYTTLDLDLQQTANRAVLDGLAVYERRKGWKGRLINVVLSGSNLEDFRHPDWSLPTLPGTYTHAVVIKVAASQVIVKAGRDLIMLTPEDWKWTGNKAADTFLKTGDLVYIRIREAKPGSTTPSSTGSVSAVPVSVALGSTTLGPPSPGSTGPGSTGPGSTALRATLEQDSGAEGSLMSVDNSSGDVLAMVGGRDFNLSQFNRAVQSERQTGSSFKPYVYTTAVEAGAKPTDMIVDAPVTFMTASGPYTPHDYESGFSGPMTLTTAFAESRNIPALKLAERVGIRKVIETAHRFGITEAIPAYLPVAIGSAEVTLFEQVASYSVFPNDGIRITPHYIRKVTSADGMLLDDETPEVKEVISTQTARTMMVLLQAVTRMGTGAAAARLKHPLGGKTGTTNDFTDAWFLGFSPSVTTGVWVGYDDRQSLGEKETGARAALPIWMDYMQAAIANKPNEQFAHDVLKDAPPVVAADKLAPSEAVAGKADAAHGNSAAAAKPTAGIKPATADSAGKQNAGSAHIQQGSARANGGSNAGASASGEQQKTPVDSTAASDGKTVYQPFVPLKGHAVPGTKTGVHGTPVTGSDGKPGPEGKSRDGDQEGERSGEPAPHPSGSGPAEPE